MMRLVNALVLGLGLAMVARAEVQTYVIVLDEDRRPVIGLATEDFYLRDGGIRQGLLDAGPATLPLDIAVVVDGFAASDREALTSALAGATARLALDNPGHRMSLLRGD